MSRSKAKRMVELIGRAPMSAGLRARFTEMAAANDTDGIIDLLQRCLNSPRGQEVAQSIDSVGGVTFESVADEVFRIYRES